MKLHTKLLLGVGFLLFGMAVTLYIVPAYFVRRDVSKAAGEIHELLVKEHQKLANSQQIWLENVINQMEEQIDAQLFMLYEEPTEATKLEFNDKNPDLNVWMGITSLASSDPDIGFVQAHNPDEDKAAVISLSSANFYPIDSFKKEGKAALFSLQDIADPHSEKKLVFIGIPLPEEDQTEEGYRLFALIDPDKAQKQLKIVEKEINRLRSKPVEKRMIDIVTAPHLHNALFWAVKTDMIRHLTPLFVEGFDFLDVHSFVPEGLARVSTSNEGYALLTDEIFSLNPFFDDKLYFEEHAPLDLSPPIATSNVLITNQEDNQAYIGNTFKSNSTYLTIGYSLSQLCSQLALSSNKTVILRVGKDFWLGFDGEGNALERSTVNKIIKTGLFDEQQGALNLDETRYLFSRVTSLKGGELSFYALDRIGGEKSIIKMLFDLEDSLTDRISLQLLIIALIAIILVLLFVARMMFSVIHPITKLAKATEDVAKGHYGEVALPDVGKRKDEVATLTHSFEEMVGGLRDRERIRGVLDKVVSKDVADEILRTQIHLGGEDCIVSMLFGDIRGFTHLTENLSPQNTIGMLNECMTKISRVIEGEGGVIDKYVGDEVMAIYGAPAKHADHALRAVSSGMLIVETLKQWNSERHEQGEVPINMGIGINSGLVVAGNMGAEDRLNYTVLGSQVNLAARLCEVAKPGELIISHSTLKEPGVEEAFYVELLEPISLKGISEPVKIYRVTGFKWEETPQ